MNEIANELTQPADPDLSARRKGRRPVFGDDEKLQSDPHFRDYIPFFEYFHGETAAAWVPRTRPAGPV